MRTTVVIEDDVMAALNDLRRERAMGLSEALNTLARAGLTAPPPSRPFVGHTRNLGLRIDVSNVAEALELLDETPDR
jgi:hypothetical protein